MPFDLILGMDWLHQHQAVLYCQGLDQVKFCHAYKTYTIPAEKFIRDQQPCISVISAATFAKTFKPIDDQLFVVRIQPVLSVDSSLVAASIRIESDPRVEQLKREYPDVLCTDQPTELPPIRPTVPTIPLVNENLTVFKQMYRLSPAERQELQNQSTDFLQRCLIRPSSSPFGSPILFVRKKDGTMRMVIDSEPQQDHG